MSPTVQPLVRRDLGDAQVGRLVFAQVREDPTVDVAALRPTGDSHVVVVTSAGCTALALLAAGAGQVTAVDRNRTQNDLAEAVAGALRLYEHGTMLRFLGAQPAPPHERAALYAGLRPSLSEQARLRWDSHPRLVARGLAHAGLTELANAPLAFAIRHLVQRPSTVDALLAASDLATQQQVFDLRWDNKRWRGAFPLLINRYTCRPLYKGFFDSIDVSKFAEVFRSGVDHALRDVPIAENWYLHDLFEGGFRPNCLPLHLRPEAQAVIAANRQRLSLIDGSLAALLRSLPDSEVTGFCLSNVGDWLTPADFAALLGEVIRVGAPGAVVVFRNFVPRDPPVPAQLAHLLVPVTPDPLAMALDRSLVRYQTVICSVRK